MQGGNAFNPEAVVSEAQATEPVVAVCEEAAADNRESGTEDVSTEETA